jgi:hypothetical protein
VKGAPSPALTRARRAAPSVSATVLIALVLVGVCGTASVTYIDHDLFFALIWGDELAGGHLPGYEGAYSPTPHPLSVAAGALVSPFGDAAPALMRAMILLSLAALIAGLFRLGRVLYAWPVGLLAAAIFATREPVLNFGPLLGYQDVPFAALVIWAVVLEAQRSRRGLPVLVLLTLAGLLRPEAWFLAAAYWLWLAPGLGWDKRLRFAGLVAVAPVVWALSDFIITGDPLWSLHDVKAYAAELSNDAYDDGDDDSGWPIGVVEAMLRHLGGLLGKPETALAVLGLAAGLVWLRRRTLLPAAVALAQCAVVFVLAGFGLPALSRFLFPAAVMLALFAAVAALGWSALDPGHHQRRRWRIAGIGLLIVIVAAAPAHIGFVDEVRARLAERSRVQSDLRELLRRPEAKAAVSACRPVYVLDSLPTSVLAYWTSTSPSEILPVEARPRSGRGLFLASASREVWRLSNSFRTRTYRQTRSAVPPGYRIVAGNRSWELYTGCGRAGV